MLKILDAWICTLSIKLLKNVKSFRAVDSCVLIISAWRSQERAYSIGAVDKNGGVEIREWMTKYHKEKSNEIWWWGWKRSLYSLLSGFQWLHGEEPTCSVEDAGSIPGSGRSPGERHGNPLQYSCLENAMDRGAWQDTVHRVTQSQTWLKRLSTHTHGLRTWDSCLWLRKNHSTGPGQRLDVFYPCFKFPRAPQCTSIWYKTKLLP